MKIVVSTHQGTLYNEEIDYFTVHKSDGDFGVMENHIPVIAVMDEGYVKIVRGNDNDNAERIIDKKSLSMGKKQKNDDLCCV